MSARKYPFDKLPPNSEWVRFPGFADLTTAPPYVAAMKYGYRTGKRFKGRTWNGCIQIRRVS